MDPRIDTEQNELISQTILNEKVPTENLLDEWTRKQHAFTYRKAPEMDEAHKEILQW